MSAEGDSWSQVRDGAASSGSDGRFDQPGTFGGGGDGVQRSGHQPTINYQESRDPYAATQQDAYAGQAQDPYSQNPAARMPQDQYGQPLNEFMYDRQGQPKSPFSDEDTRFLQSFSRQVFGSWMIGSTVGFLGGRYLAQTRPIPRPRLFMVAATLAPPLILWNCCIMYHKSRLREINEVLRKTMEKDREYFFHI